MTPLETFESIWDQQLPGVLYVDTVNQRVDTDTLPDIWASAVYQSETSDDVTMGSKPWVEERGQFLIGLFTRSGSGAKALDATVAAVRQALAGAARDGLFISAVDGPHDVEPQADGEWWQVALTARFAFQSRRDQAGPLYHGWQGFGSGD